MTTKKTPQKQLDQMQRKVPCKYCDHMVAMSGKWKHERSKTCERGRVTKHLRSQIQPQMTPEEISKAIRYFQTLQKEIVK